MVQKQWETRTDRGKTRHDVPIKKTVCMNEGCGEVYETPEQYEENARRRRELTKALFRRNMRIFSREVSEKQHSPIDNIEEGDRPDSV